MTPDDDYQWFLGADLSRYRGRHIAILEGRVVSSGRNARDVWQRANRKHPGKDFLMAKVPEEDLLIL